ncbi:MAG: ACT domain-containing protein [Thermodesulfobacteriota bacterium]|nr:ACT domain-containing protein [Thermodesulfobacteriota bacterium]
MSKQMVISVMSKDRPGIIADITTVIFGLGGDLADLNQSVLGGYFTMILIAEFDNTVTPEDLLAGFSHIDSETKIEATIKEMSKSLETEKEKLPLETYIVTAQGENRKGLVKTMGEFFYSRNINVLDLVTTKEKQKYTMIFQVDLSPISSMNTFRQDLQNLADTENMDLVLQHNDIFMATNEIGIQLHTIIEN